LPLSNAPHIKTAIIDVIYVEAGLTFDNLTCANNRVVQNGGCLFVESNARPLVRRSRFDANVAVVGAAVYIFGGAAYPRFEDCLFSNNRASYYGGAVYASTLSAIELTNCSFVNNTLALSAEAVEPPEGLLGGAVYLGATGAISNCRFVDNSADYGGGVFIARSEVPLSGPCARLLNNSFFAFNVATYSGGAVYVDGPNPPCAAFPGLTFNLNNASFGGPIGFAPSSLTLLRQPQSVYSGETFEVVVAVNDTFGHPILRFRSGIALTVAVAAAPSRLFSLAGEKRSVVVDSVAAFRALALSGVEGDYSLVFVASLRLNPRLLTLRMTKCGDGFVVRNDSNNVPTCVRPLTLLPAETRVAVFVVAGLLIAVSAATFGAIRRFRRTPEMKAAAPVFLSVIVLGVIVMLVAAVAYAMTQSPTAADDMPSVGSSFCRSVPWLLGVAFALIFGSFISKTYRIYKLFYRTGLRRIAIPNRKLIRLTAVIVGGEVVICALWQSIDPLVLVEEVTSNGRFVICASDNMALWAGLYGAYQGAVLLWGVFLAFQTRNVTTQFNEAKVEVGGCRDRAGDCVQRVQHRHDRRDCCRDEPRH
jgi:predicted outer membrane repeat protein